ncbi:Gluconolactonase (plasmid) [Caballeronia sp. SBC1]|uniref:SMP-30/gluconolactonase/LRE family protein n=1 Tax=Caballeronia sp. SBC1 TaxID=2705548 RepID=UPI0014085360|nr:SMP-30/gluconolactonase/LRE family protein [Caballeronia sp. SBC1]QIN67406.1 Gluconolactonase [Caballeronia sp. SBC1]
MDFEIVDSRFKAMVLPNAPLEKLGEGFRWLEGPVWFADFDCLLFSDLPNDRIMRWTESGGISVFRQPSGFANGHTRDRQGRLIGCSHRHRCITRTELDGSITVLADRYQGKRLNSPNDVIVKSDGTIWFSDPPYGIQTDYEGGKQAAELPAFVYRLVPEIGTLTVVSEAFTGPNGLCFSPDESLLYVSESGLQFDSSPVQHISVIDLADGGARCSEPRLFHKVEPGFADGFRCDEEGNLWTSAADGVHCVAPSGDLLGKIRVPSTVSNLTFGGRNRSRLFICASHTLFAVYTNRRGAQRP